MKALLVAIVTFFGLVLGVWVIGQLSDLLITIIPALAARPNLAAFIVICLIAIIGIAIAWFSQNGISAGINYDEDCE